MGVIGLVARVFFVLLLAGKVSQESCPVISEQGVALLGYTFESFISSEFWECYRMCRDEIQCWSLNYHLESRRCDLNSETRERQPSKSVRRDSIVYFDDRKAHNKGILRSCKDLEVLAGRRSGEYWIDPEANRTLVKEYCYFDIAGYGSCENITSKVDGAYVLDINGDRVEVWCQMTNLTGCDPGKWTLAAKVDGKKQTFLYDSTYWTDKNGYNYEGGKALDDEQETKLPTFWATPMKHVCIGMRNSSGGTVEWLQLTVRELTTLYEVFSTNNHHPTNIPLSKWLGLVGPSSGVLQKNCNRQGFNAESGEDRAGARIGVVANNEADCNSCDSFIGIGTKQNPSFSRGFSCGNECFYGPCKDVLGRLFDKYQQRTFGFVLIKSTSA